MADSSGIIIGYIFPSVVIAFIFAFIWKRRALIVFSAKYPKAWIIFYAFKLLKNYKEILPMIGEPFHKLKCNTYFTWLGWEAAVFTIDPDLCDKILLSPDMLNKSKIYNGLELLFGAGLLSSKEDIWQDHRRKINPSFNTKTLQSFFPVFNKGMRNISSSFEHMADDSKEHDLEDKIRRVLFGVTFETVIGKQLKEGELADENYFAAVHRGCAKAPLSFILSLINLEMLFKFTKVYAESKRLLTDVIMNLVAEQTSKSSVLCDAYLNDDGNMIKKCPTNFISEALKLHNVGKFSLDEIVAESNIIVAAAFDTTPTAIFICICMLAMHPKIQEQLFEEIIGVFPDEDSEIQADCFKMMPYLDMILKETIRLFPPGAMVGRRTVRDTQLDENLVFPKNLQVVLCIYDLHRRTDIWGPNANHFNPDNFLPENIAKRHPGAYLPFLKGSRNCIGQRYAYYQMKIVLIGLVRKFQFNTKWKMDELRVGTTVNLCFMKNPTVQINRRK